MNKRFRLKIRYAAEVLTHILGRREGKKYCPCCGYRGFFDAYGSPPRYSVFCPQCGSLERHRMLVLVDQNEDLFTGREILHFSPEPIISQYIGPRARRYSTADYFSRKADLILNIEDIDQPDQSWDIVICSHVLEHVNDELALQELHRILRKGGRLIVMVPVIEGWEKTYENTNVITAEDRQKHFGQQDHVRWYGHDIRSRLKNYGFNVCEHTAYGEDCVKFGLERGGKVFICMRTYDRQDKI